MTIANILANELTAFYTLQQPSGLNAGAVMNYYASLPGSLMSPYAAQVSLCYALRAYHGQTPPAALVSMTLNYITYALKKLMWTLGNASSAGTDAAGVAYLSGDQIMTLFDGTIYAIPKSYRTPAGQSGGTVTTYTTPQQAQVALNVQGLFIKGCPLVQYARNSDSIIMPGWVLNTPNMSFTTPLNQITGTTYQEIHDAWYDATDSYAATLIALIGEYLRLQDNATFKTWLLANWQPLIALADASLATTDVITTLAMATPYTTSEYTLDNIEVWKGLYEFCNIMQRALQVDAKTFSSAFDITGKTPGDQIAHYNFQANQKAAAINKYCQQHGSSVNGMFVPGWNGTIQSGLTPFLTTNPQYLDAFAFTWLDTYSWGDSANGYSIAIPKASYLSTMTTQGLSTPSSIADPNIWRYIIGANELVATDAPFTRTTYENWINTINTTCIVGTNRNYQCWWSVESGSLIWICNILLSKGST